MIFFPVIVLCGVVVYFVINKDFKRRYNVFKNKIAKKDYDYLYDFWSCIEGLFPKKGEYSEIGYFVRVIKATQQLIDFLDEDSNMENQIKRIIDEQNYVLVENQNIKTFIMNKNLLSHATSELFLVEGQYRITKFVFPDGDSMLETQEHQPRGGTNSNQQNAPLSPKLSRTIHSRRTSEKSKILIALSPNFSMEKKIDLLWEKYPNGIYIHRNSLAARLSVENNPPDDEESLFSRDSFTIEHLKNAQPNFYGDAKARLDQFVGNVDLFRKAKIQRNYLLIGRPGTGKSQFSLQASRIISNSKRILKISAELFANFQKEEMDFILFFLKPYCIIIDDFDRVFSDYKTNSQDIMYFFEGLKSEEFADTTIFCTVNSFQNMGEAILRPGRFDEILVFHLPKQKERKEVLLSFFKEFEVVIPNTKQLDQLVRLTDGYSQAYLREFCLQCKYDLNIDHTITKIKITKQFISTEDFKGNEDEFFVENNE